MKKIEASAHEGFIHEIKPEGEIAKVMKNLRFPISIEPPEGPKEAESQAHS
jgi:hypothetical protein